MDCGGRRSVGDWCSTAISADRRDISENAARSRSRSASKFSARDFIYESKSAGAVPDSRKCRWIDTYSSDGIASGDELVVVVVHKTLAFAVELPHF